MLLILGFSVSLLLTPAWNSFSKACVGNDPLTQIRLIPVKSRCTSKIETIELEEICMVAAERGLPPRVEYTLTELGYSLKPILDVMWNWGEAYRAKKG